VLIRASARHRMAPYAIAGDDDEPTPPDTPDEGTGAVAPPRFWGAGGGVR